jgi:hypothetical protein
MSNHPIIPPPELVEQWWDAVPGTFTHLADEMQLATAAAQWGADQQLEACCEQLKSIPSPIGIPFGEMASNALRNACRPQPPSLKEQALALLDKAEDPSWDINDFSIIRQALEQLND